MRGYGLCVALGGPLTALPLRLAPGNEANDPPEKSLESEQFN